MDIKIGFADSPRELVIPTDVSQEEIAGKISEALRDESGILELEDNQGKCYLVRNARISYVELGKQHARTVGFAGA